MSEKISNLSFTGLVDVTLGLSDSKSMLLAKSSLGGNDKYREQKNKKL